MGQNEHDADARPFGARNAAACKNPAWSLANADVPRRLAPRSHRSALRRPRTSSRLKPESLASEASFDLRSVFWRSSFRQLPARSRPSQCPKATGTFAATFRASKVEVGSARSLESTGSVINSWVRLERKRSTPTREFVRQPRRPCIA